MTSFPVKNVQLGSFNNYDLTATKYYNIVTYPTLPHEIGGEHHVAAPHPAAHQLGYVTI